MNQFDTSVTPSNTDAIAASCPTAALWTGHDMECSPVTISVAPVGPAQTNELQNLKPFGVVSWGVRGTMLKAFFDIGTGRQFSISGSTVRLQIGMDGDGASSAAQSYSAMITAFDLTQKQIPLTRSYLIPAVGAGSLEEVLVPPFAQDVIVYRTSQASDFSVAGVLANGGQVLSQAFAANVLMTTPIRLPEGIQYIRVASTAGLIQTFVVFGLGI